MLIKRVDEIDPLCCPKCQGQMKVVAFIEPSQGAVIEKILRHCGLGNPATPRPRHRKTAGSMSRTPNGTAARFHPSSPGN